LYPGYPVIAIIDAVVSGWNETCLKDTDGGYCNGENSPDKSPSRPTTDMTRQPKSRLSRPGPNSRTCPRPNYALSVLVKSFVSCKGRRTLPTTSSTARHSSTSTSVSPLFWPR
jgi:hypothetical protein